MLKKSISILLSIIFLFNVQIFAIEPEEMPLDEKIGQMLCLDFRKWENEGTSKPVTEINDDIKRIISDYHIGTVILFKENFVDKEQAKTLINDLKKAATDSNNLPLIIDVDQEGGRVERFAFGRSKLKNNADIKTDEEAFNKGATISKELKELGINCDAAPVIDVNSNPDNPVINNRSFSDNPDIVSEMGEQFVKGLHSNDIITTGKHFPGHGDTNTDSHLSLPTLDKTLDDLYQTELKPFIKLSKVVDMIMTAHISLPKIETQTIKSKKDGKEIFLPATLSKTILTDLLRKEIGFNGVIITDAMNMKAISDHIGQEEATKMAISAGADIILMPVTIQNKNDISKLESLTSYLKEAIKNNEISEKQINESIKRIIKLKNNFCQ